MAICSLKCSHIFSCIFPGCEEVHFSYILNKLWSKALKAEAISSLKEKPLFLFFLCLLLLNPSRNMLFILNLWSCNLSRAVEKHSDPFWPTITLKNKLFLQNSFPQTGVLFLSAVFCWYSAAAEIVKSIIYSSCFLKYQWLCHFTEVPLK